MTLIVRMYAGEEQARSAARKVVAAGLREEFVSVLSSPAGGALAAVKAAVADGRLPRNHIARCAQAIEQGRSVVTVQAPFKTALMVESALDEAEPVDSERLPEQNYASTTPLSDAFGLPLLARGTFLSLGWNLTESNFRLSSMFGMGQLTDSKATLSSALGMQTLKTPSSSRTSSFGIPLLSSKTTSPLGANALTGAKRRPWTSSFGMPLLTSNSTPLSSLFGMRLLSKRRR